MVFDPSRSVPVKKASTGFDPSRSVPVGNRLSDTTRQELNRLNSNAGNKEYMYIPGQNVVEFNPGGISRAWNLLRRAYHSGDLGTERSQLGVQVLNGNKDPGIESRISEIDKEMAGPDPLIGVLPPPDEGWASYIGKTVAEEIPNIAGFMGAGLEKGLATGAGNMLAAAIPGPQQPFVAAMLPITFGAGFTAGSLEYAYRQMAGDSFLEYRNFTDDEGNKLPEDMARLGAIITGAVGAGLEAAPMGLLFRILPGTRKVFEKAGFKALDAIKIPKSTKLMKDFLFNMAQIAAAEGGTEILQEGLQVEVGEILKSFADTSGEFEKVTTAELLDRMKEAGIKGAIVGGALGGAATGASTSVDLAQSAAGKRALQRAAKQIREEEFVKEALAEEAGGVTPEVVAETAKEVKAVVKDIEAKVAPEETSITEEEQVAKVEEALQEVGPDPETRTTLIRGRLKVLDEKILNIDKQVELLNDKIDKLTKDKKTTKAPEKKVSNLLDERAELDLERDDVILLGLANDLKVSKKRSPQEEKRQVEETRVNIEKKEAELILEELEKGNELERQFKTDAFGVVAEVFVEKSTNPAFLSGRADLGVPDPQALNVVGLKQGGKKPNRRSKRAVINAVKRVINGKPAPNDPAQAALHNRILEIIEDRLSEAQPRFQPGTGQVSPERGNSAQEIAEAQAEEKGTTIQDLFNELSDETKESLPEVDTNKDIQIKGKKLVKLEEQSLKAQERALSKGLKEGARLAKKDIKQAIKNTKQLIRQTSLPKNVKDSLITQFVTGEADFIKNIPKLKSKIGTEFERLAVKEQKDRIKKLLSHKSIKPRVVSGVRKGKFTADIQERLEELRDLKKISSKKTRDDLTQDEIDLEALEQFESVAELFKTSGEFDPAEGISPAQALLDKRLFDQEEKGIRDPLGNMVLNMKANPKELTSARLKHLADTIEDLITEGKNAAKERNNNRKNKNDVLSSNAADSIRTVTEQLRIDSTALGQKVVTIGKGIKNARRYAAENWQGLVDIGFNLKGVDNTEIIKALSVRREFSEAIRLQNLWGNKYRDRVKSAIRTTSDAVYNKRMREDHTRFNAGKRLIEQGKRDLSEGDKFINARGQVETINITKSEIRNLHLTWQQVSSRDTLFHEDGNAFTEDIKDEFGNVIRRGTLNELFSLLDETDFAIMEARLDIIEEMFGPHNNVYRKLNGINLKRDEKGGRYFPFSRTTGARDIVGFKDDQTMRTTVNISSQKIRRENRFKFRMVSDESVMQRHIFEVSHYIATADKFTDLRQIISDTKLKDAMDSKFGPIFHRMLADNVTDFIRGRVEKGKILDKYINEMNSRFAASVLRLKPIIGIKQLLSIPAYLDKVPVKDFIAGELDFLLNSQKAIKILREVPSIASRMPNPEVAIANIAQDVENIRLSLKRGTKWSKLMDANIRMGDIGAIYAGGWALYKYSRKQGKTHQEALNIVEDTTLDRQQSQALNQLSSLQRGHSLGRSLTAFASAPLSYLRAEFQAVRQGVRGKISPYQAGRQFAIFHFLLPTIWQFVADGFDVEEEHLLRAAILGNFNVIPILGDLLLAIYNQLIEEKSFDVEAIPFLAALNDMYRGIGDIAESGLDIDTEEFYDGVKRLASVLGKLNRQPVQQFFNIYEGVRDLTEDGPTKDTVLQTLGQPPVKK